MAHLLAAGRVSAAALVVLSLSPLSLLSAQTLDFANISPSAQLRWTAVSVPAAAAAKLPAVSACGPFLAVKGRAVGSMVRQLYVLGGLGGRGITSADLRPLWSVQPPPFALGPWVAKNDGHAVAPVLRWRMRIAEQGKAARWVDLRLLALAEDHPVRKVLKLGFTPAEGGGVWCELWLTFWAYQDVVDIEGRWGWHDTTRPDWSAFFDAVELHSGEPVELYWADRMCYRKVGTSWPSRAAWSLFRSDGSWRAGELPHAFAPHFHGVALMSAPKGVTDPARRALIDAARGGPLLGVGNRSTWDGHWFSFGVVPAPPDGYDGNQVAADADAEWTRQAKYLAGTATDGYEERPFANRYNTGYTGGQAPFGATKGWWAVTAGDARALWAYLHSSTDYGLRSFHYREPHGGRVTTAAHPRWQFSPANTDPRISRDTLGKASTRPWGWDLDRSGPDDQHRGQNYMWATLALTGSWVLEEVGKDLIECDHPGRPAGTTISAPRGMRVLQDRAMLAQLLPGAWKDKAWSAAMRAVDTWRNAWVGGKVGGPVRPLEVLSPDPRVLPNDPAFVPWNEGLGCLGLLELHRLAVREGRGSEAQRIRGLLEPVARTHVLYGTARDSTTGELVPLNGVRWLADGAPNPASYYAIPRAGATPGFDPNRDLLLGSGGWFWWWTGTLSAVLEFAPAGSKERVLAREIWDKILVRDSWAHSEWRATGVR